MKRTLLFTMAVSLFILTAPNYAATSGDYTYTDNGGGTCTITKYNGPGGNITIPDTLNGLTVTVIGYASFRDCSSLTSITIPDSVTTVRSDFVSGCSGLETITVDGLNPEYSSLDGVLFNKDQTELIQYPLAKAGPYTIPEGVASIGNSAFGDCSALTSINIPDSVISIGYYAFYGCSSLLEISVDAANPVYSSQDGVFFNKDQTMLLRYPQAKAGAYIIPDTVTSWVNDAFHDCVGLTSLFIPHGATDSWRHGTSAVYGCSNLMVITVSELNPFFSSFDGVLFNKDQTELILYPPAKAGAYIVPDGVTYIASVAFRNCTELTSIMLPPSVTSVGSSVFGGCESLSGLYFKGDAPYFGQYAFYYLDNAVIYYIPSMAGWGTTFGGLPTAEWPPSPADADLNYEVDFYDFSVLAAHWDQTGCDASNNWCGWADFDQSGGVDIVDLSIFADEWMFGILWVHECSLSIADVDVDGDVNFVDFVSFAAAWRSTNGDAAYDLLCDISDPVDGVVNEADLQVFADQWLITPCQ